ncbi:hypothetical protein KR009_000236 [Drosophila setifemur]|nr:hypothetical protein KR009_000236 [Drosophila setifemur]
MLPGGSGQNSDFGTQGRRGSGTGAGSGSGSGAGASKATKRLAKASHHSHPGKMTASGASGSSGAGRAGGGAVRGQGAMTTVTAVAVPGKAIVTHNPNPHSVHHHHGHGHHRHGRNHKGVHRCPGKGSNATGAGTGPGAGRCQVDGFVGGLESYLGLLGWRKKCLYMLLLLLMLLIVANLVLTLWIMKVMDFSTVINPSPPAHNTLANPVSISIFQEGMGQLKILPGGIQLTGQAIIMDMLRASTIRSRPGHPISIESSRNFSINTRDPNGMIENHLFLGHDKFECLSAGFRINDTNGRSLFSVNRDEVTIGAHSLRIEGEGGAVFRKSVQTPHIRAEPGRELRLESPTRALEMTAAKDIVLQSRAGGMEILSLGDVKFRTLDGSLRLESSKILMPNLRTAQPPILGTAQSRDHMHRVFQLCACSSGKLFLASPHSICAGDDSTVCR